jgi:hypothetical protein
MRYEDQGGECYECDLLPFEKISRIEKPIQSTP